MEGENDSLNKIKRLEREARATRTLLVLALIVSAASLFIAWRADHRRVFSAREFVMTDDRGNALANLSHTPFGTCLQLKGHQKTTTASLCVGDDYGADLFLANQNGSDRAFLSAGSRLYEGGDALPPGLVISQADGQNMISAILGNETKIVVGHGTEKNSILIQTGSERPLIRAMDNNGNTVWSSLSK